MYALNLNDDGRILSACICIDGQEYATTVDTLPEGDITEYKYVNKEYVHNPLPAETASEGTDETEVSAAALEMIIDHEYRISMMELGISE